MKIHFLTPFKHGYDAYAQGDQRTVPDADATYFIAHGWAREALGVGEGAEPSPVPSVPPVTLDVQSLLHDQEHRNG